MRLLYLDMINIPLLVEVYDAETHELINSEVKLINLKNKNQELYMDNAARGVYGTDDLKLGQNFSLTVSASEHESQVVSLSTNTLKEFDPDTFKLVEKIYLTPIKKTEPVILPMVKTVHFDINKSTLSISSLYIVNKIKEFLVENPSAIIVIHAHTDNRGNDESNMKLSQNRGKAVMEWFINNGIDAGRIMVKSYGEDKPIVNNDAHEQRSKNRRAEIEIIF